MLTSVGSEIQNEYDGMFLGRFLKINESGALSDFFLLDGEGQLKYKTSDSSEAENDIYNDSVDPTLISDMSIHDFVFFGRRTGLFRKRYEM